MKVVREYAAFTAASAYTLEASFIKIGKGIAPSEIVKPWVWNSVMAISMFLGLVVPFSMSPSESLTRGCSFGSIAMIAIEIRLCLDWVGTIWRDRAISDEREELLEARVT